MNSDIHALYDLLYWQASDLARARRYAEAELLLANFEQADNVYKAKAYDLRARMLIQRREYAKARVILQNAIALDPENTQPKDALQHLPAYERQRRWLLVARVCGGIFIVAAVACAAVTFAFRRGPSSDDAVSRVAVPEKTGIPLAMAPSLVAPTSEPIGSATNRQSSEAASIAPSSLPGNSQPAAPTWPSLNVPGLRIATNATALTVVFDDPVFSYRLQLSENAQHVLADLMDQLRPDLKHLRLAIEGHTDSDPMPPGASFKDNYALGYARALTVAEILRTTHNIPADALLISSAGADCPPFPDANEVSKARNRTVVIRVFVRDTEESSEKGTP